MKPRISILSKEFDYVPAAKTDLKARFEKEREKPAEAKKKPKAPAIPFAHLKR